MIKKLRRLLGRCKRWAMWHCNYALLRKPKVESAIPRSEAITQEIIEGLKAHDVRMIEFEVDVDDYKRYMGGADYSSFPGYYGGGAQANFPEKSLEHYLAAKLLELSGQDTYIDIANDMSPTPEIYNKLYGSKVYRQDLAFAAGIEENVIGGDAGRMPVGDGFASKMALHCSFEHFEEDADIRFIREANRVLRKGGRLCILPLYLHNRYVINTDPSVLPCGGISFEADALLCCVRGTGQRHGRHYDVAHFISRIKNNMEGLNLTIYVIQNAREVDRSCYVKFAALFEKE